MDTYSQDFKVRWSDVDANAHVRHSVYADYCATLRMSWLASHGFDYRKLRSLGLGPILFKETTSYYKELVPNSTVTVNLLCGAMSESGHKWKIEHQILKDGNQVAAHLLAEGAWFHVKDRKVQPPPSDLLKIMTEAVRSPNYHTL